MAYLDVNRNLCVSPGIENHNEIVTQYVEEFRRLQSRLRRVSSSMKESLPVIRNDDKIEDSIAECVSLLELCEQQCMRYYIYG